jgi:hypothetical protein
MTLSQLLMAIEIGKKLESRLDRLRDLSTIVESPERGDKIDGYIRLTESKLNQEIDWDNVYELDMHI